MGPSAEVNTALCRAVNSRLEAGLSPLQTGVADPASSCSGVNRPSVPSTWQGGRRGVDTDVEPLVLH